MIQRLCFLAIALLPCVVVQARAQLTVVLLILQAFPVVIATTSFLSMMADAVPADRIPYVVGLRWAGWGIATTLGGLLAGRVLALLPFPRNYQVLFLIGFAASLMSQWHCIHLCVPDRPAETDGSARWWQAVGQTLSHRRYTCFVLVVAMLQLGIGMATPLFPLLWVRRLGATDGQISLIVTVFSATMVLGSLLLRRHAARIGRARVLAVGVAGYALYPLLASVSPGVYWLFPWTALGGFFNAAISVALFDNLVAISPERGRTNFVAVYNLFVSGALFAGPLLAGLVTGWPDGPALGLRLAGGLALSAAVLFAVSLGVVGPLSLPGRARPAPAPVETEGPHA
jgi:MFS family permease